MVFYSFLWEIVDTFTELAKWFTTDHFMTKAAAELSVWQATCDSSWLELLPKLWQMKLWQTGEATMNREEDEGWGWVWGRCMWVLALAIRLF